MEVIFSTGAQLLMCSRLEESCTYRSRIKGYLHSDFVNLTKRSVPVGTRHEQKRRTTCELRESDLLQSRNRAVSPCELHKHSFFF
jgi:hypothetical protein